MSKTLPLATAIFLMPLAISQANADEHTTHLDELTVVADPLAVTHTYMNTELVDETALRQMQPKSVPEAVKHLPNVTVAGGPRAGSQTVNIRGLEGRRVLQTVDGVRQVFESGHRPSYLLDPALLRSIEVIKGPASTRGSGALGGVIAQETITASDILESGDAFGGFVKTGVNTNNNGSDSIVTLAGQNDSIDWLFSGFYRDHDNIELGNNEELENSGSEDAGILAKGSWHLDNTQNLRLSYRKAGEDGAVPSNGAGSAGSSNSIINREQKTQNLLLGYHLNTESEQVDADLSFFWNQVSMDESRITDSRFDSTDLNVYGFNANNLSTFEAFQLFYGVDGHQEQFDAEREGTTRPNPPSGESNLLGAFVQGMVPLNNQWSLELGSRYDYFETEADGSGKRSDNAFSPSAAIIWQPKEWLELTLRHDHSFRAPSSEELYTTGTHFCFYAGFCNTFESNPDLEAEKAANTELITAFNFDDLENGAQFSLTTSIFQNTVDNFIEQIVTAPNFMAFDPGKTTWVNVDKAKITGFEISADYALDNFLATVSYGMVRGEDADSGEDLTNIPADTFKADLSYQVTSGFRAGLRVTHALEQNRTENEDVSTDAYDGYTITDLYATWDSPTVDGLSVDLSVNNLSNQYYRVAWAELYEPGREIIASIRYDF